MKNLFYLLFFVYCTLSTVEAQCWPTTVDSAITVAPGWYPYAAVDEEEQSVMVAYLAGAQIRVKKYDKYGCPMWGGSPAIALDTIQRVWLGYWGNQWGQVISDDSGGVVICWVDFRHSDISDGEPVNDEVYVQRIDVNGQARYGPNGMQVSGPHTDGYHTIGDMKTDYHGGYMITYGGDSSHTRTVLKRYDMNGVLQWVRYFNSTGGIDLNATDVWGSSFVSTGGRRYKYGLQGNSLWPGGLPGHIPDNLDFRKGGAFSDRGGGAIGVTSWYSSGDYVLTVNRVDSNGQFAFGGGVDVARSGWVKETPDNEGGVYVAWKSEGARIQRTSHYGILLYDTAGVSPCYFACGEMPQIVSSDDNGTVLIWPDFRNSPLTSFYAQRIDTAGQLLWDSSGVELYTTSDDPLFSQSIIPIHPDGRGGAIYVWEDLGAGLNIRMKQISKNGVIGQVDTTTSIANEEQPKKRTFTLYQNYPNPFNNTTTIEYHLKQQGEVDLRIFNVLGQEVRQVIRALQYPGFHEIAVDMNGLSSGIYMYRLKTPFGIQSRKMVYIK